MTTDDITTAENLLVKIAEENDFSVEQLANDLMEYKAHSGNVFGRSHIWLAGSNLKTDPLIWWKANGSGTALGSVSLIIMSYPASIACVERANKEYSIQKTTKRNRLTDHRSEKVTRIAYTGNLKISERQMKACTFRKHVALTPPNDTQKETVPPVSLTTEKGKLIMICYH